MSTSIGPAFRIKRRSTQEVKDDLLPILHDSVLDYVSGWVVDEALQRTWLITPEKSFHEKVSEQILKDCTDDSDSFMHTMVGSASFIIYQPPQFPDFTYVLCRGMGNSSLWEEKVLLLGYEDYSYYDATDEQLSFMSHEEWKDRLRVWEQILPHNHILPEGTDVMFERVFLFPDGLIADVVADDVVSRAQRGSAPIISKLRWRQNLAWDLYMRSDAGRKFFEEVVGDRISEFIKAHHEFTTGKLIPDGVDDLYAKVDEFIDAHPTGLFVNEE